MNEECREQIAVVGYLKAKYPNALFTIPPNGMKLPMGVAVKMKRMGYRRGSPDLMIFEPKFKWGTLKEKEEIYHGLFIELKRSAIYGKSTVSPEQKEWIEELNARGYKAVVCVGAQEAYKVIDDYLGAK